VIKPRSTPTAYVARARPTPAMLAGVAASVLSGINPFSGLVWCQKYEKVAR
jgi:hypothetical protein